MQTLARRQEPETITVRPMRDADLAWADHIMRVAFGTYLGVPDPVTVFGDADYVRPRFLAAPDCAWTAEIDGEVVGSNLATRWGSFAFFGPLTVRADLQDRGIGSRLMEPVVEAFESWGLRQSGLFTFPHSAKHIGLYQKHGFWPRFLNPVMSKAVGDASADYTTYSEVADAQRPTVLQAVRGLTDAVFAGLDLEREIHAVDSQALGDRILLHDGAELVGLAVCHCGSGTEAGSGACFVKFGPRARALRRRRVSSGSWTPASAWRPRPAWSASWRASIPAVWTPTGGCSPAASAPTCWWASPCAPGPTGPTTTARTTT